VTSPEGAPPGASDERIAPRVEAVAAHAERPEWIDAAGSHVAEGPGGPSIAAVPTDQASTAAMSPPALTEPPSAPVPNVPARAAVATARPPAAPAPPDAATPVGDLGPVAGRFPGPSSPAPIEDRPNGQGSNGQGSIGPGSNGLPTRDQPAEGPGCTAPQLRRFIKSRSYVPMHELRRRFGINGTEDDVTGVEVDGSRIFFGLPPHEGHLLGDLVRGGEVGYQLSLDPRSPVVIGVFPMRPVPRH